MSRRPRKRLPEPISYTTEGGALGRDLMLIRIARDGHDSSVAARYWDLEATRYDAHQYGRIAEARSIMIETHQRLVRDGLTVSPTRDSGAVVHRVNETDLPPRLMDELAHWEPEPGRPASHGVRRSIIPWLLLARCPDDMSAYVATGSASHMPYARSRSRCATDRPSVSQTRRRATVERMRSHLRELGQAALLRFSRNMTELDRNREPLIGVCPELCGTSLLGTPQYLQRGTAVASLRWHNDAAWLTLTLTTSGGVATRYATRLPAVTAAADESADLRLLQQR